MKSIVLMVLACAVVAGADEKGDKIVKASDKTRTPKSPHSLYVEVRDEDDGEIKESVFKVYSNGLTYSLVDQMQPARQKGRKLLMRDYDLWLFTPGISRPARISFEQKLTGEVANGDLTRTNFADDYSATLIGEEDVGGQPAYKLELVARNKDVTYRKITFWVAKKNKYPLKADFFALSGKLLKTAVYSEFKKQMGAMRISKIAITDSLQKGRKSILTFSKMKSEKIGDEFFSKEALGN